MLFRGDDGCESSAQAESDFFTRSNEAMLRQKWPRQLPDLGSKGNCFPRYIRFGNMQRKTL